MIRDPAPLIEALGGLEKWTKNCHAASIELVYSGVLAEARVARGWCDGVSSQHSWVVLGDPYDKTVEIIDPTLWSYTTNIPAIWFGTAKDKPRHTPHGSEGTIFTYGRPDLPVGPVIPLGKPLSPSAQHFLDFMSPQGLDRQGWGILAHAPVTGWPAREIITAMYENDDLRVLIPVDIVGMLTDKNPKGLYMRKSDGT